MLNIWSVLNQTIHVSIVAGILLLLKYLLKDKLSPRWQYHIWIILFISVLIPVGLFHAYIIPQVHVLLEMFKSIVESNLNSTYSSAYMPVYNTFILPYITSLPASVTDMIFLIYIIGIIVSIIKNIFEYAKLKLVISKGRLISEYTKNQITLICQQYHLKVYKTVIIEQMPSPFVFGVIKPALVLTNENIDDKVILHELLHLKYHDSMQNIIWSLLVCLHWFNPFMHYIHHIIGNDLESLCDQRVLELLEGEDRREYGKILLSMTNNQFPRGFGTTSLSNGSKNIKKRIEAIVRFKKYPKGMLIVSICIGILLLPLSVGITTTSGYYNDITSTNYNLAGARLTTCSTYLGAIDTYAKAIILQNDVYYSMVMSEEDLKDYTNQLENKITLNTNNIVNYRIINLSKNNNIYKATLLFTELENNTYNYYLIPIQIFNHHGWKVKQADTITYYQNLSYEDAYQFMNDMSYSNDKGTYQLEICFEYDFTMNSEDIITSSYIDAPITNAACDDYMIYVQTSYHMEDYSDAISYGIYI
ncbi:MAG: M56 family metallopeptidase [Erysipelotrichaceae bacterium]|nr:M56 family metallopeptidase [Erysipelotrichaceae bacterium]